MKPYYNFTAVKRNARAQFNHRLKSLRFQASTFGNYCKVEFCRLHMFSILLVQFGNENGKGIKFLLRLTSVNVNHIHV